MTSAGLHVYFLLSSLILIASARQSSPSRKLSRRQVARGKNFFSRQELPSRCGASRASAGAAGKAVPRRLRRCSREDWLRGARAIQAVRWDYTVIEEMGHADFSVSPVYR